MAGAKVDGTGVAGAVVAGAGLAGVGDGVGSVVVGAGLGTGVGDRVVCDRLRAGACVLGAAVDGEEEAGADVGSAASASVSVCCCVSVPVLPGPAHVPPISTLPDPGAGALAHPPPPVERGKRNQGEVET